jgi:hypothetical protein
VQIKFLEKIGLAKDVYAYDIDLEKVDGEQMRKAA